MCMLFVGTYLQAATITATASGDWDDTGVWDLGRLPLPGDDIIIPDGIVVTVPALTAIDLTGVGTTTITIQNGGELNGGGLSQIRLDDTNDVVQIDSGGIINPSMSIRFGTSFPYTTIVISNIACCGFVPDVPGPATIDNSGLPIDLIVFEAASKNKLTILEWSTFSEFNFDYFEIQRAIGSTDFKPIGEIEGAGEDVETIQEYEFIDEKPLNGINYYRLKSIDLDGTFEYSDIQAVKHAFDSRFDIYPNPSDGTSLNVLMDEVQEGYQIVVYDNMGLQVYENPIKGHDEAYAMPNLKSGVYTIKLLGRGDNPVQKLVVY